MISNSVLAAKGREKSFLSAALSGTSVIALCIGLGTAQVHAADQTWDGETDSVFNTGTNWVSDAFNADDTAIFDAATETLTVAPALSVGGISLVNTSDITITGGNNLTINGPVNIEAGSILGLSGLTGTVDFTVTNEGTLSLGATSGMDGLITVNGAGSTNLDGLNSASLTVGGTGTVNATVASGYDNLTLTNTGGLTNSEASDASINVTTSFDSSVAITSATNALNITTADLHQRTGHDDSDANVTITVTGTRYDYRAAQTLAGDPGHNFTVGAGGDTTLTADAGGATRDIGVEATGTLDLDGNALAANNLTVEGTLDNDGGAAIVTVATDFSSTGSIDGSTGAITVNAADVYIADGHSTSGTVSLNATGTTFDSMTSGSIQSIGSAYNLANTANRDLGTDIDAGANNVTITENADLNSNGNDLTNIGTLDNAGILTVGTGDTFSGSSFTNQSTGSVDSNGSFLFGSNTITNNGTFNAESAMTGNLVNNGSSAIFNVTGNLASVPAGSAATGTVTNSNDGEIGVAAGAKWITSGFTNSSDGDGNPGVSIAATGEIEATTFTNENGGTVTVSGTLTTTDGGATEIDNQSGGTLSVDGGTLAGNVTTGGDLDLSGTANITGNLVVSVGGTVDTDDVAAGELPSVDNSGTFTLGVSGDNPVTLNIGGTDSFTQTAGSLTAQAGDDATISIATDGDFNMNGGSMSNIDTFTNSGDVDIAAGAVLQADTINHNGGNITIAAAANASAGGELRATGNTLNIDAQIDVGENGAVTDDGTITIENDGVLNIVDADATIAARLAADADIVIEAGGELNFDGAGALVVSNFAENADQDIDNAGTLSLVGGGTVTGINIIDQDDGGADTAVLNVNGTVTVHEIELRDGVMNAQGTINFGDGANDKIDLYDGTVLNLTGDLTVNGDSTQTGNSRNELEVSDGAIIAAADGNEYELILGENTVLDIRNGGLIDGDFNDPGGSIVIMANTEGTKVKGEHRIDDTSVTINYGALGTQVVCDEALTTSYGNNIEVCADGTYVAEVDAGGLDMGGFNLTVEGDGDETRDDGFDDGLYGAVGAANGENVDQDGELLVNDGNITNVATLNNAGYVGVGLDGTTQSITTTTSVVNTGIIDILDGSITTVTLDNDRIINVGADGSLIITGNTTMNDGIVNIDTGGTVTEAGDWTNQSNGEVNFLSTALGGIEPDGTSDRSLAVVGTFTNEGDIVFAEDSGDSTFTAGNVINNDTFTVSDDARAHMGSTTITNNDTMTVALGGRLDTTGLITNNDTLNLGGVIAGNILNDTASGEIVASGTTAEVIGDVTNQNDAQINVAAGVSLTVEDMTNSSDNGGGNGVEVASTATLATDSFTNSGSGTTQIDGTLTASDTDAAAIAITGGQFTTGSAAVVSGNITNNAQVDMGGTYTGDIVNSGSGVEFEVQSKLAGVLDAAHGDILNQNDARFDVDDGQLITRDVTNTSGGTGTSYATAGFAVNSGETLTGRSFDNDGGTVHVDGTMTLDNGASVEFQNRASSTLTVDGSLTGELNNAGIALINGTAFSAITNSNELTVDGASLQAVTNSTGGTFTVTDTTFGGNVDNAASMVVSGTNDLADNNLTLNGGTIDMDDDGDSATDAINNVGALTVASGTTTLQVDMNRTGAGESDSIAVSSLAHSGGNVVVEVDLDGDTETGFVAIIERDADAPAGALDDIFGAFSMESTQVGSRIHLLARNEATGEIGTTLAVANSAASSVSSVTMSEAILNVVVNRPSSPFVTGLAFEDENPCSTGTWARGTGGIAEVKNGSSSNVGDDAITIVGPQNTIETTFTGVHGGADFGCFDERFGGWNLAAGGLVGLNFGSTSQDNFELGYDGPQTRTSSTYQQTYAGGYVVGVKGNLAVDIQARAERTAYKISNTDPFGSGFETWDLDDTPFETNGYTVSGGIQYFVTLNEDKGIILVPTAGMGLTKTTSDELYLGGTDMVTVSPQDRETRIGFIGATLAQQTINDDGVSASTKFATLTYYQDMSDDAITDYAEDGGEEGIITTNAIGSFAEASAGWSYVKILDAGTARAARQFNAAIRVDGRFSSDVSAIGVTGQARWQF